MISNVNYNRIEKAIQYLAKNYKTPHLPERIASPSYTILNRKYSIRVANTNHRSRKKDFNILIEESVKIGQELST
jgi:hypothetical protein